MKNTCLTLRTSWALLRYGIILLGVLSACEPVRGQESVELARFMSPDSLVDAVLVRDNQHATTAFVYRVYLMPHGQTTPAKGTEQLRADHVEGLVLQWTAPSMLVVQFDKARVFHFSNFWNAREVHDFRHTVELRLAPTSDSAL